MELSNCRDWEGLPFPPLQAWIPLEAGTIAEWKGPGRLYQLREGAREKGTGFLPFFALLQPISSSLPR